MTCKRTLIRGSYIFWDIHEYVDDDSLEEFEHPMFIQHKNMDTRYYYLNNSASFESARKSAEKYENICMFC